MKKILAFLFVLFLTPTAFAAAAGPAAHALFDALPPAGTPPAGNWANYTAVPIPMSGGMDGEVYAVAVDSSGSLYAGGAFENPGGCYTNCEYIAKWNGSTWSALETGMNNQVDTLWVDGSGNVYAGGRFTRAGSCTSGCNYIAKWNGSAWSALGGGMNGWVATLAMDSSGNLYAGGQFTAAGSCASGCRYIAKWDGSTWSSVGGGITSGSYVSALALDGNGILYAGGNFSSAAGCPAANGCEYLAKWNGSAWSSVGGRAGWIILDLAVDSSNNLYAGGMFTAMPGCGSGCNRVAQWNGSAWSALEVGMPNSGSEVYGLALDGSGNLYAGGNFSRAGSCTSGCNGIARWDGAAWTPLGSGVFDNASGLQSAAATMVYDGRGRLYVGGYFTRTGSKRANYISYWTAGEGRCGLAEGGDYTLYAGNLPVGLHVNALGTLDCLSVQRFNGNHPNAQSYQNTGYYWSLRGLDSSNNPATGFDVRLTLPYASADAGDSLCRWRNNAWGCNRSSYVANTSVTLDHVVNFSDWAVGNEAPTAVTLDGFKAAPDRAHPWGMALLAVAGLAMGAALVRLKTIYKNHDIAN